MIGDVGREEFRPHAGDFRDFARDQLQAVLPFFLQSVVIFVEIHLQRLDHSDDFFLADFLAAAEGVFVRAVVEQGAGYELFASD